MVSIGKVVMFDPARGFGYINIQQGMRDVRFSLAGIVFDGGPLPQVGDTVRFEAHSNGNGRRAQATSVEVRREEAQPALRQDGYRLRTKTRSVERVKKGQCTGCGSPIYPGINWCGACDSRLR